MDEKSLTEYLKKLEDFERVLSNEDEDNIDQEYIKQIEKTLSDLSMDAITHVSGGQTTSSYNLNCNIKKLHPNALIPLYSKEGDAGMDMTATEVINDTSLQVTYGTGIAVEIPKGYVGLVFPRSSIRKYELELSNSVGVIDSGYRGEIQATFNKTNGLDSVKYEVGDRICQIMILPYPNVIFNEVSELTDTERGGGGFGSTGK